MDSDVVTAKLESLRRCIERVRTRTPASVEELSTDHDAQDIICLNLERAVQACVDITRLWEMVAGSIGTSIR